MRHKVQSWWAHQIDEVQTDRLMHTFGALLSCIHIYSFFWWYRSIGTLLETQAAPICWSFFPSCHILRVFPGWLIDGAFSVYGLTAVATMALFLWGRIRWALPLLLVLNFVKYMILLQDVRLMGNYHYMAFVVSFAWILLPYKFLVPQVFLILCYFAAGTLKLNPEWLSGASLGGFPPWLPEAFVPWLNAYAAFLELVIIFGLMAHRSLWRWMTLGQLTLFHIASIYWVGWFYPVNMLTMLMIFPFAWARQRPLELATLKTLPATAYAAIAVFVFAQAFPHFSHRDPALSGDLRISSLNMYDARAQCFGVILLQYRDHWVEYDTAEITDLSLRVQCDPGVFVQEARNLCREQTRVSNDFVELHMKVVAKRTTDRNYTLVLNQRNFCQVDSRSSLFHWVNPEDSI